MKIIAIISKDLKKASTQFRLTQYLDYLKGKGITVEFIYRNSITSQDIEKVKNADLLFNQKCLIQGLTSRKLWKAARKVMFDFDDAIYTRPGKPAFFLTRWRQQARIKAWIQQSHWVTVSNERLASYACQFSDRVEIIPMSLDLSHWHPIPKQDHALTIGWTGSPVNAPLVARLDPILKEIQHKYPQVQVAISCGIRPNLTCPFQYVPYQPGKEPDFVQQLDIGLLPLDSDEHSQGKTPIKALQYLSCGIPVVGNVLGATAEVLCEQNSIAVHDSQQWIQALSHLIEHPS